MASRVELVTRQQCGSGGLQPRRRASSSSSSSSIQYRTLFQCIAYRALRQFPQNPMNAMVMVMVKLIMNATSPECYISLPLTLSSSPLPPYVFPSPLIPPPPPAPHPHPHPFLLMIRHEYINRTRVSLQSPASLVRPSPNNTARVAR